MKAYCCQPMVAQVSQTRKTCVSTQVPTFYLSPNVQGLLSVEDAERVVRSICNPTGSKAVTVFPNVTEVEIN